MEIAADTCREYDEEDEEDYDEYDEEDEEEEEADAESDYEEELMYRSYEILSDFYKKHFVDLRVLDTSCDPVSKSSRITSSFPSSKGHHCRKRSPLPTWTGGT